MSDKWTKRGAIVSAMAMAMSGDSIDHEPEQDRIMRGRYPKLPSPKLKKQKFKRNKKRGY